MLISEKFDFISFWVFNIWMCSKFLGIGYCRLLGFMFVVKGIMIWLGIIVKLVMMLFIIFCKVFFNLGKFNIFNKFVKLNVIFGFFRKNIVNFLIIDWFVKRGFRIIWSGLWIWKFEIFSWMFFIVSFSCVFLL